MKWEEPPAPAHSTAAQIEAEVRELKANPGRWALVREGMASTGATMPWKERGCETTSRKNAEGRVDVWARWNGGPESDDAEPDPASLPDPYKMGVWARWNKEPEDDDVEPDPESLPDPYKMGGYMAARAARQEKAAAYGIRPGQGGQIKTWRPGGVAAPATAPARSVRGTRRGK